MVEDIFLENGWGETIRLSVTGDESDVVEVLVMDCYGDAKTSLSLEQVHKIVDWFGRLQIK